MKRMKTLGLGAVAALALTLGMGAASASASSGFMTDEYPATLSGTPNTTFSLASGIGSVGKCYSALTGSVTKPSESAAVSPEAEISCLPSKIKTNGCKFNFRPGTETSKGVFGGSVEIAPGCSGISFAQAGCTFNFPPQTGLSTTYENVGTGKTAEVKVSISAEGLEYVVSGSGCSVGTYHNGYLSNGNWNVRGLDPKGNQVGVHVAHQISFLMGGEQSEDPTKQPRFKAENYPAGILGKQATQQVFKTSTLGSFKCNAVGLAGTMLAAGNAAVLDPEFVGCSFAGYKATIRTNSCDYAFNVANVSGPYSGALSLACSGSDQLEIEFKAAGTCTVKVPAQALATVSYETTGVGVSSKVLAQLNGSGIEYSVSSGCEAAAGTYKDATLSGSTTLEAML